MTVVQLPRQFRAEQLFSTIRQEFGELDEIPDTVEFDFSRMGFVRPSGIVFLSNLTRFLVRSKCRVRYVGMKKDKECIRYLDDSGFFKQHIGRTLRDGCAPRNTTRPLHSLKHADSHSWIGNDLLPWLSNSSGVPVAEFAEFNTCMSEVFNNIKDHTALDVGSVFAQWYPQESKLEIVVADFGVGIPKTVRRVEEQPDDNTAIIRAFDDGFSSQSTPQNRGAGLYYLRQNVLDHLGGKLTVRSQSGAVEFSKSGNLVRTMPYTELRYCPGTMIEMVIRTDQIEFDTEEIEDFQW